jgi:hypothetical protein
VSTYKNVIQDNLYARNDSFLFWLHERYTFRADRFDELCQSVEKLAQEEISLEMTRTVTYIYQCILKEIIYHFDPNDSSVIKDLPQNYTQYLERFDCALARYFTYG